MAREQCEMAMKEAATHHDEKNRDADEDKIYSSGPAGQSFYLLRELSSEPQGVQDIKKYLIRREMLSAGLLKFDDRPENYWSWKASFQSATKDLNRSAREELDLMTKWLGVESAEQAKRIRSVHVFNPTAALNFVWQRLEECYGSPEVVEHALLRKIGDFPKLTNKDNAKLRELGYILLEIECAKEGGHLPGLSYLDTARGVNPIVEKLPYSKQERWISTGSKYKEEYGVAFPPFSFFSSFVRLLSRVRNDPSFAFTSPSNQSSRTEKYTRTGNRASVNVHKTDVPQESSTIQCNSERKMESPDKQCPIHKKPHPLKKCRSFRAKPIEERKLFLKENYICFRRCGSTQHVAKKCRVAIKCIECDSEKTYLSTTSWSTSHYNREQRSR